MQVAVSTKGGETETIILLSFFCLVALGHPVLEADTIAQDQDQWERERASSYLYRQVFHAAVSSGTFLTTK